MNQYRAFVPFNDEMMPIDEIIGINSDLCFFNPIRINGNLQDFKIQTSKRILLVDEEGNAKSLTEMRKHFYIINECGEVIADSHNLHPEEIEAHMYFIEAIGDIEDSEKSQWN